MAINIVAPGIYSEIVDVSDFVDAQPSTSGFIPFISEKGPDNVLTRVTRSSFYKKFGEPNINYTNNTSFGMGPYIASSFLEESNNLYVIRCLPPNATFSNIGVSVELESDGNHTVTSDPISGMNTIQEIETQLSGNFDSVGDKLVVAVFRGLGRGEYYNNFQIDINRHPDPTSLTANGSPIYILDIYQKQVFASQFTNEGNLDDDSADYILVEQFEVAFDPEARNNTGNSIFVEDVINEFSNFIRCHVNHEALKYLVIKEGEGDKVFFSNAFRQSYGRTEHEILSDLIFPQTVNFDSSTQIEYGTGDPNVSLIITSPNTNIQGYLDSEIDGNLNIAEVKFINLSPGDEGAELYYDANYSDTETPVSGSLIGISLKSDDDPTTVPQGTFVTLYVYQDSNVLVKESFYGINMDEGDDKLFNANGTINYAVANNILVKAFNGTLESSEGSGIYVNEVFDTEEVRFDAVFDAGYPTDVKNSIATLVNNRKDCMAFLDNGDHKTANMAINSRRYGPTKDYNSPYIALYEMYTKIYDDFTGKDIWVPPTYHISRIIGYADRVTELWYPLGGFNRAVITGIKEMRYNPNLGDRETFIMNNINPIVRFGEGSAVFSQRTTLRRSTARQDINVVRLIIFIDKSLKDFCRRFIFEINDNETWSQISQEINRFLAEVKNRRGLTSYSVNVYATAYDIRLRRVKVDIELEPIRGIEQIHLRYFVN